MSVPLIPLEELFGDPVKATPRLSPDGTRLAYLAPDEGCLNIWLRTLGKDDDRPITNDRKRGIRDFYWAYDNRHIIYPQDRMGDEDWHIWCVDLDSGSISDLTPFEGTHSALTEISHLVPDAVLLVHNARDKRLHDVCRADLSTGELTLVAENPGDVTGWFATPNFEVLVAAASRPDGGFDLRVRDSVDGEWRRLVSWLPEDEGQPMGFTPDLRGIYAGDSRGADTTQLRVIDLATGEHTTLAADAQADLGEVLLHPTKHHVQAAGFTVDRLEWAVLDPDIAGDFIYLQSLLPGEFNVVSRSVDDNLWLVHSNTDLRPPAYYLYDRASQSLDFLFSIKPALEEYQLAEMRPVRITARDGLTLHCYLSLPPGVEPKNLPMVLNVHGGPWARDAWGFDLEAQWLANRGYACLQVNYRGSTGFGKRFVHAGDHEWGGKMHDDLIDAVQWAIGEGIADPKRIAIYGGSYGGYAALVGATFTPDIFACAVDIVGPSSLMTFLGNIPPYWEPVRPLLSVRVGDMETEREFLDSRSPLFKADRIQCPMLIAQGANDPRVKQSESEQIVAAMRERGKEVEYMLFEDEGHGFARPENKLKFFGAAERFLARHLGGRAQ